MSKRSKIKNLASSLIRGNSRSASPSCTAENTASEASNANHEHPHLVHEATSSMTIPTGVNSTSESHQPPSSNNAALATVPIQKLWEVAYEELKKEDNNLVREYEEKMCGGLPGGLAMMLGIPVQKRMAIVLQYKMERINQETWKLKFKSTEVQVGDIVQPILGVVNWVNEYIGDLLSKNTYTAIPWAGVSLLLPLFLNPSEQNASLAEGLEYMASLIAQSRIQEELYTRRYENATHTSQPFKTSHTEYRNALSKMYQEILRFQMSIYIYCTKNKVARLGRDMIQRDDWEIRLQKLQAQERAFSSINDKWRDMKYDEESEKATTRHKEALLHWQTIGEDVSGLRKAVEDAQEENRRDNFLEWLCSANLSEIYNTALDKHTEGTGDWLPDSHQFSTWETSPRSFLRLHGKAGCGKSVLSSTVIKHLKDKYGSNPESVLAYFFFSFSDVKKQTVSAMLSSLVRQLYSSRPDTPKEIEALAACKKRGEWPDTKALETALLAATHGFSSVFIVVDALDECPPSNQERNKLLSCLKRILSKMSSNLHILVTSRPELDITKSLSAAMGSPARIAINLMEDERVAIDNDIRFYINSTLADDKYENWTDVIKSKVRNDLVKKADGMFQYVCCQFEVLERFSTPAQVLDALKTLPAGLDATYERLLCGIDKTFQSQVVRALKLLAVACRPIRLDELAEIFVLQPNNQPVLDEQERLFESKDCLKYMTGLIVTFIKKNEYGISSDSFTCVRLAHFSVKEYLTSGRVAEANQKTGRVNQFLFTDTEAHFHVARACLTYHLCFSDERDRRQLEKYTLRHYAAQNWILHLEEVPRDKWTDEVAHMAARALAYGSQSLSFTDDLIREYAGKSPLERSTFTRSFSRPNLLCMTAHVCLPQMVEFILSLRDTAGTHRYIIQEDLDLALQKAAYAGSLSVVKLLVEKGANVNGNEGSKFGTALHAAASKGFTEIAGFLLQNGADIHYHHSTLGTVLHAAVESGLGMVQFLVDHGADIKQCYNDTGSQPSAWLGRIKDSDMLQFLLDSGMDINYGSKSSSGSMFYQSCNDSSSFFEILLERKADVNAGPGGLFGFPLQALCVREQSDYDKVKLLLDAGADVNASGGRYGSALQAAAVNSSSIVKLLLDAGADVNASGGRYGSALQAAAVHNSSIVKLLLDAGADVNASGGEYGSALQAAAVHNSSIVKLLLDAGADVNASGGRYGSALQAACYATNMDAVHLLLDRGANINAEGGKYGTALQAACVTDDGADIALLLIERGANVHACGNGQYGSAWFATAANSKLKSYLPVMQKMLDSGVDVNDARGKKYPTALHAVLLNSSSIQETGSAIRFLLDHSADVNLQAGTFGSPLQSFCASGTDDWNADLDDNSIDYRNMYVDVHGTDFWLQARDNDESLLFLLDTCKSINVNAQGGLYGTALQAAAYMGKAAIVRTLLDRGANNNMRGGKCRSALNAAIFKGYWDIVEILLAAGAVPDCQLQLEVDHQEWLAQIGEEFGQIALRRYEKAWKIHEADAAHSKTDQPT